MPMREFLRLHRALTEIVRAENDSGTLQDEEG